MKGRLWYWLLAIPYVGTLWVPFYAKLTPPLFGIPFFYWYQILWIVIGSLITGLVLLITRRQGDG
ncbi:MAG: DUF3311 domain-containing protein [Candidatus Eremiobacteraeota bacterium]|nr:DUF3311 domain-containing protein [Candidatus Eremiobacteraeota bacterium]